MTLQINFLTFIWNFFLLEHSPIDVQDDHCEKHVCILHNSVWEDSPPQETEGQFRILVLFPPPQLFEQTDHEFHKSNWQNISSIQVSIFLSSWFAAGYSFWQSSLSTFLFFWIHLRVVIFSPLPQVWEHALLVQSSQYGQLKSDINSCLFCWFLEHDNIWITLSSRICWMRTSYSFS